MSSPPRIYVAGHRGLVGSAIVRRLQQEPSHELITRTHAELDLTDTAATESFFAATRPQQDAERLAQVGDF